jgi:hypothetical protein
MAKQETDYTGQVSWNQAENWQRTQTQQTLVTMQLTLSAYSPWKFGNL